MSQALEGMRASEQFEKVYSRLKLMAGARLAGRGTATLNTTALVHELYLKIGAMDSLRFDSEQKFFAYAAHAMRHLLADHARERFSGVPAKRETM